MFDPRKVKRCAYCKRWEGDAQLRKGNTNGTVAFKDGVYGKCLKNQHPVQAASNGGNTCKDYAISVEADRFI